WRPNAGEPPVLMNPLVSSTLGSSHAPAAGMGLAEAQRMYSAAWHMWAPGNCAPQAACIVGRPDIGALAAVNPAKATWGAPLQQASERATLQEPPELMPPSGCT